jgi:hypothetical protein
MGADRGLERSASAERAARGPEWGGSRGPKPVASCEDDVNRFRQAVATGGSSRSWRALETPAALLRLGKPQVAELDPPCERVAVPLFQGIEEAMAPTKRRARMDPNDRGGLPHGQPGGETQCIAWPAVELLDVTGRRAREVAERPPARNAPVALPGRKLAPPVNGAGATTVGTAKPECESALAESADKGFERPGIGLRACHGGRLRSTAGHLHG